MMIISLRFLIIFSEVLLLSELIKNQYSKYITECKINKFKKCHHLQQYHAYLYVIYVMISGEDGRSRAEQLLHLLGQIDQYVSSSVEYQRRRGCLAAYEMLLKFRTLCVTGYCPLGCLGSCTHSKQVDRSQHRISNLPCIISFSKQLLCYYI